MIDNTRVSRQELDAMPPDALLLVSYLLEGQWMCVQCPRDEVIQTIERAATGPLRVSDFRVWVPGPEVAIQTRAILMDKRTGG